MLSIAVKMDTVTVSEIDGVSKAKVNPTTKVLLDCTNKDVTCISRNEEVVVDLLDYQEDSAVDLDAKSPQKKRIKLVDTECIIMGEELSDMEINLA